MCTILGSGFVLTSRPFWSSLGKGYDHIGASLAFFLNGIIPPLFELRLLCTSFVHPPCFGGACTWRIEFS